MKDFESYDKGLFVWGYFLGYCIAKAAAAKARGGDSNMSVDFFMSKDVAADELHNF